MEQTKKGDEKSSKERVAKKEEKLVEKLMNQFLLILKKHHEHHKLGPTSSTPVRLIWSPPAHKKVPSFTNFHYNNNNKITFTPVPLTFVSARKLAASLWEFQHYYYFGLSNMRRGSTSHLHDATTINGTAASAAGGGGGGEHRLRRRHHDNDNHHRHHHRGGGGGGGHRFKDKGLDLSQFLADASPSSPDLHPESAGSLRRHIATSLIQHHRSIERSNRALQPVSPASYGSSSMEITAYNPAVTPGSSLDIKGRMGDSRYNLKTSTELLKVLNRIWSLEEQHASHVSLIKALKTELDHARVRIKELLRDQQSDRREIDELMKQIAEDKIVRKSKEQDRLNATVQSLREELEDERKLRKRSETLHRKLARELSEVKSSFSNALKEVENERKSRMLLEDLCDEFAKGIKDYEREVHTLKQKFDKDSVVWVDRDHLIMHISESWLDERMQIRLDEAQHGFIENDSLVDRLGFEIEAFLKAKQASSSKNPENMLPTRERRHSMESVHLNEAVSAPQHIGDEEDSEDIDSHCFELNKPNNGNQEMICEDINAPVDDTVKSSRTKKKLASRERVRGHHPPNLQVKFEENIESAMAGNENNESSRVADLEMVVKAAEAQPTETVVPHNEVEEVGELNSNDMIDNLIRSHISLSEAVNTRSENDTGEASCSYLPRRNASPVRQWMSKLATPDLDIAESSTKPMTNAKENTLKAKLLEARTKGQRSRLKLFRG